MKVAVFTDNDFDKVNGVTTTLTAVLQHAPADVTPRIYTAAALAADRPDYLALRSFGLGIPFILAAFAMEPFTRFLRRFRSRLAYVEKVMGVLLVLTGLAFLTGGISTMSFWLLETFPALGRLG